ncbi:MAG: radical SAM protein [archaeon]
MHELRIGNICNNNCAICGHIGNKSGCNMGTIDIRRNLRALAAQSSEIVISGGEPAIREDYREIMDYASSLFDKVTVRTNGRIFSYREYCDTAENAIITFFTHKPELHNKITGTDSFDQTIAGIRNLVAGKKQVKINHVICSANYDHLPQTFDFLGDLGVKSVIYSFADIGLDKAMPAILEIVKKGTGINVEFSEYRQYISILANRMFCGPALAQFEITNNCNHNCIFCYHHSPLLKREDDPYWKTHKFNREYVKRTQEWRNKRIDPQLVKSYIDEMAGAGTTYVQFAGGGEPMTHPEIMDMIRYVKKKGLTLQIFSNSALITPQRMKLMHKWGVDVIETNISAVTKETYAKVHPGREDDFALVKNNLKALMSMKQNATDKPEIRIMNTITNLNAHEIDIMPQFAHEHGASSVYLGLLQTTEITEHLLPQDIPMVSSKIGSALSYLKKHPLTNNFRQYLELIKNEKTRDGSHSMDIYDRTGCFIGYLEIQVHVDNKVAPCCLHPTILDIKGRSFAEVWNSDEYQRFRDRLQETFISKANKELLCRGCRMCVYLPEHLKWHKKLQDKKLIKHLYKNETNPQTA